MLDNLLLLVVLSPIVPPSWVPHKAPTAVWTALKSVAERMEVWPISGAWNSDFRSELHYIRDQARLLRDAPLLEETAFFPSRVEVLAMHAFYLQRQYYLERLRPLKLHRREEIDQLLTEARQQAHLWCLVNTATDEGQSWPCRRQALRELRDR